MKKFELFNAIIIPLSIIMLLTGCSSSVTSDNDKTKGISTEKEKKIEYLNKEYLVKYPTNKIITASYESIEDAVALSVKPIGAVTISGEMPDYVKNDLGNSVKNVGDKFSPDIETVSSLNPDVILGSTKFDDKVTDNLTKIAPTINVSHKSDNWEDNLKLLAKLTNKTEEADQLIANYNQQVDEFKAKNPVIKDKKILIVRIRQGELYVYGPNLYYNPMLYNDLGFKIPDVVSKTSAQTVISTEQLSKIDADIILVQFINSENKSTPNALKDLKVNTIWKNIQAVRNQQVFYNIVDGGYQGGTYLSKETMLMALENIDIK